MPWSASPGPARPLRRAAHQAAALLLLAALPAILTAWLHPRRPAWPPAEDSIPRISITDALMLARNNPVIWADARSAGAFAAEHIPGAINVTEADWERSLAGLADVWRPGQPVIVYCAGGGCETSRSVASRLRRDLKVTDVYVLKGGWEAWLRLQK